MEGFAFLMIDSSSKSDLRESNDATISTINRYTRLLTAYQLHYKYNLVKINYQIVEDLGYDDEQWLKQIG